MKLEIKTEYPDFVRLVGDEIHLEHYAEIHWHFYKQRVPLGQKITLAEITEISEQGEKIYEIVTEAYSCTAGDVYCNGEEAFMVPSWIVYCYDDSNIDYCEHMREYARRGEWEYVT